MLQWPFSSTANMKLETSSSSSRGGFSVSVSCKYLLVIVVIAHSDLIANYSSVGTWLLLVIIFFGLRLNSPHRRCSARNVQLRSHSTFSCWTLNGPIHIFFANSRDRFNLPEFVVFSWNSIISSAKCVIPCELKDLFLMIKRSAGTLESFSPLLTRLRSPFVDLRSSWAERKRGNVSDD